MSIKCPNCGYFPSREGYNCANCGQDVGYPQVTTGIVLIILGILAVLLFMCGPLMLAIYSFFRYRQGKSYKLWTIGAAVLSVIIGVYFFYSCKNQYYGDPIAPNAPMIDPEHVGWFYTAFISNILALLVSVYVLKLTPKLPDASTEAIGESPEVGKPR
jgi:hypothetical protein